MVDQIESFFGVVAVGRPPAETCERESQSHTERERETERERDREREGGRERERESTADRTQLVRTMNVLNSALKR